jgi:hypothetical protein
MESPQDSPDKRASSNVGPSLEDDDLQPSELHPAFEQVMAEAWDDPAMDVYDDYDARRSPR